MNDAIRYSRGALFGGLAVFALLSASPARAADASAWSEDSKSAVRLIAGVNKDDAALRAGIEVKLQPGWHTYWRYPGDSCVPPRFDFSGSDNVKSARVRFPAPRLFSDDSGGVIYRVSVAGDAPAPPVQTPSPPPGDAGAPPDAG